MSQMNLFDSCEKLLVDDDRGRITYIPEFVDAATAAAWFDELRDAVQWRSERRLMYEREVDVPRLMAHYRLDPPPASTPRRSCRPWRARPSDYRFHSTASA